MKNITVSMNHQKWIRDVRDFVVFTVRAVKTGGNSSLTVIVLFYVTKLSVVIPPGYWSESTLRNADRHLLCLGTHYQGKSERNEPFAVWSMLSSPKTHV